MANSSLGATMRQGHPFECGLCCATWALTKGRASQASLLEMRRRFSWAVKPLTMGQLRQLLAQMGVSSTAVRAEPEHFLKQHVPAIVHWQHNHFVVLIRVMKNGNWLVYDPAQGDVEVTKDDVNRCFTGVALTSLLVASPAHVAKDTRNKIPVPINRPVALLILLLTLVAQMLLVMTPMQMQWVIDHLAVSSARNETYVGIGAFFLLGMLIAVITAVKDTLVLENHLGAKLASRQILHTKLIEQTGLSVGHSVGETLSRIATLSELVRIRIHSAINAFADIVFLVTALMLMAYYYWPLALLSLIAIGVHMLLSAFVMNVVRRRAAQDLSAQANLSTHVAQWAAAKIAKRFNQGSESLNNHWATLCERQRETESATQRLLVNLKALVSAIRAIELGGMYLLLVNAFNVGTISVGMIAALAAWRAMLAVRSEGLVKYHQERRMMSLYDERIVELIERDEIEQHKITLALKGSVTFSASKTSVIDSFELSAGERLLLSGPSGSGKSYFLRSLLGYQSDDTDIYFDGVHVKQISSIALEASIGWVSSTDPVDGLLIENFGECGVSEATKIIESLQRVGLGQWFLSLPLGLYTPLDSVELSDGQRSRIAIARVLFKQPKIVLLDEPLAHLDERNSTIVATALEQMPATQIWVHHGDAPIRFDHYRKTKGLYDHSKGHNTAGECDAGHG